MENEVSFYNEEEDENYYLSEYKLTGYAANHDPRQYEYYLFDMVGDNKPELCITEDYFKAHEQSKAAIKRCKYTYDDLFGSKP